MERVAVVTGGASGIGRGVSGCLVRAGHRVAIADLDGTAATQVAEELGAAMAVVVDVSSRSSVVDAFAAVRSELGPIEILVTSAAVSGFVPFAELTDEQWRTTIEVNLTGTFFCMQEALTDMVGAGWGRIVTISSAAGQVGAARQGHYSASKGGVIAMTKAVALEYAARGVTVNTIPPFVVESPMLESNQAAGLLPSSDVLRRTIPARRLGTPEDIGEMCAFLCSDAAGYVTGQVIGVNGGAVS